MGLFCLRNLKSKVEIQKLKLSKTVIDFQVDINAIENYT